MYTAKLILSAQHSEQDISRLSESLEGLASAHVAMRRDNNDRSPWVLEWITEAPLAAHDLSARLILQAQIHGIALENLDWSIAEIPENFDWLAHSYRQFQPFSVGPFYIYGSHITSGVPDGQIGLQIDAATAFGSGEHGTTKGCLTAMLDLNARGLCPWNVLDMGTGSGILAIAAWKLWKTPVLAVDNDPESVRVAEHHRDLNKVPAGKTDMDCAVGEGFAAARAQEKKPYDLVIANILAGPLKEMAADLEAVCDDNGYVILSGILNEQAQDVLDVYLPLGFVLKKTYEIGEWSTLVLHHPPA